MKKELSADLQIERDGVNIKLSVDLHGVLKAGFLFQLIPIELKEEVLKLKDQLQNAHLFTKVDSQSFSADSRVIWGNAEGSGSSLIKTCMGLNQITIDTDGWYQVTIYCPPPHSSKYLYTLNASRMSGIIFLSTITLVLSLENGDELSNKAPANLHPGNCQITLLKLSGLSV